MRPIPLVLLPHTIEYHERETGGRYEGSYKPPITIRNVRVEKSNAVVKTGPDEEKALKGKLFMDVVNSSEAFEMVPQSKIVFQGKEMFVENVKPITAYELHHYEVQLV